MMQFTEYSDRPLNPPHYNFERPVEDDELFARCVSPPLAEYSAVVPILSKENDRATIKYRVSEVQNHKPNKKSKIRKWSNEFVKYFVELLDNRETLSPWEDQEVYEKMTKKNRARGIENNEQIHVYSNIGDIKCFQKKESYPKLNAPRNISPVDDEHLLETYRFSYPFTIRIKEKTAEMAGYMPGRSPDEIRSVIQQLKPTTLFGADYSKFDGTQDHFLRQILTRIMVQMFPCHYKKRIEYFMRNELGATSVTTFGIKFPVNGTMVSGSAFTTLGNTITNLFVYYAAYRMGYGMKIHKSKDQASTIRSLFYQMMDEVACYGDDSLGPKKIKKFFFAAVHELGLVATEEDDTYGVCFLGRIYPHKFRGEMSFMDPRRLIPKLHITCAPRGFPIDVVAANRAVGLKSCCPNEEVVQAWANAVLRAVGREKQTKIDLRYATHDEKRAEEEKYGSTEVWTDDMLAEYHYLFQEILGSYLTVTEIVDILDNDEFPLGWFEETSNLTNKFQEPIFVTKMKGEYDVLENVEIMSLI